MELAHLRAMASGLIPASEYLLGAMEAKRLAAQSALQEVVAAWARGMMPGMRMEFRPDRRPGRPRSAAVDVADLQIAGRFKEVAQALDYRCGMLERAHHDPFVLRPNHNEPHESFIARVARDLVQWAWENTSCSWLPRFRRRKLKSVQAKAIVREALDKRGPRLSLNRIAYGLLAARARASAKAVQSALERAELGVETRHPTKVSTPRYYRGSLQSHA
jgi:hypothetical protein